MVQRCYKAPTWEDLAGMSEYLSSVHLNIKHLTWLYPSSLPLPKVTLQSVQLFVVGLFFFQSHLKSSEIFSRTGTEAAFHWALALFHFFQEAAAKTDTMNQRTK